MASFFSWLATAVIAFLNVNTAMMLVPGDWNDIKLIFAIPISLIACLLFDNMVAQEYCRERLRRFAQSTLKWINSEKERLSQSPLGKIRVEEYFSLYRMFESPFLEPSMTAIVNRTWCSCYFIVELIMGVYFLNEKQPDLNWLFMIAPILAGLLNLATGLLKGQLIVYPKALAELRKKYKEYEASI